MAQNENNMAEIGFENEIWDADCILCGNLDVAEYKQVVLGLIFLKYIHIGLRKSIVNFWKKGMDLRKTLMNIRL